MIRTHTIVSDTYRWLEDDNSTETAAWVEAQNKITVNYLRDISHNEKIINVRILSKKYHNLCFKNINNAVFVKSKYDLQNYRINDSNIINISSKTSYGIKKLLSIIFKNLSENHISENIYISRKDINHAL